MLIVLASAFAFLGASSRSEANETQYQIMPERDVVAAMQDYMYRYSVQGYFLRDIRVTIHGNRAYASAYVGVDGRGAMLKNVRGLWHVLGEAKGQFSADEFSNYGVSPRIALLAVETECPPLSTETHSMSPEQRILAKRTRAGHVPARRVRDVNDRWLSLAAIDYRICDI